VTIVEFLRARYEDEWTHLDELDDLQSFPQSIHWTPRRFTAPGTGAGLAVEVVAGPKSYVRFYPDQPQSTPDWGWVVNEHARLVFSQHDVQRRLRDVEAKRRIVDLVVSDYVHPGYVEAWRDVLALLALPYADHSDYDPTWSPA
jgi:hypothetical protein